MEDRSSDDGVSGGGAGAAMSAVSEQYERLITALVYPEHSHAYRTNAEFRAAVELIARSMPRFIAIMEEEAVERAAQYESMARALARGDQR